MQPDLAVLLAVLALPFVGAALIGPLHRVLGERVAYVAAGVAAACFGLLVSQYPAAINPDPAASAVALPWVPELGVSLTLYLDGLALLIGLLASGVGVLIFTYSGAYMHGESGQPKYYATLLAFMGSMLGVALAADLLALFVFWELTSVTSYLLIGHHSREDPSLYASRKAMVITVAGGLFMLVGFLLLAHVSGLAGARTLTLIGTESSLAANADAIYATLSGEGLLVPVLLLLGIGAAAKSAQFPLHVWLPNAMEAPTPVSAFLHSATMVKAGVYLVGRFRPLLLPDLALPEWSLLFGILGLVSMTITAALAVGATDIKELLAYSTASHLGLIIAGFGFAPVAHPALGAETGAFHILNHAAFKAALFLVAGIVAHEAGTRRIDELGGLRHDMPIVAGVTAVAALGMAGVPPFNGFYSKELLFETTWEVAVHEGGLAWLFPAIAVFGSVFTFLYSIRFLMLFFGDRPEGLHAHRPPLPMLAPAVLLAVVAAAIGLYPQGAIDLIVHPAVESTATGEVDALKLSVIPKVKPALYMSGLTVGLGAVAYQRYGALHRAVRRLRSVPYTSPNAGYDAAVAGIATLSTRLDRRLQTGLVRTYAGTTLAAVSLLALGGYVAADAAFPAITGFGAEPLVPVALVLTVAVGGVVAVLIAPSHVAGVLTLSILGFMVAVFFVLADAPDLALTQLVVETLVLVIFLLVLDKLPTWYGEPERRRVAVDTLLAGTVGATVFLTVVLSTAASPDGALVRYFLERAPVPAEHGAFFTDYGGGNNVVNVILVDFRAFDTLGEISVVAMAAVAVVTLVGMRGGASG